MLFNKKSSKPIWQWQAHKGKKDKTVHSLSFTYDGKFLFSAGSDRYVCNWDIQNNHRQVSRNPVKKGLESKWVLGRLYAAAFTKEGNAAIVAFEDITMPKFGRYRIDQNYLILYSIENGSLSPNPLHRDEQYRDDITSIALCPTTCRFLVSGAKDGSVYITDLRTGSQVFKDALQGPVQDVAFSSEANWLAAVTSKGGLFGAESMLRAWQIE
jgi:WD40 repeat protein